MAIAGTLLCTTHKLWAAASFAEWSSPGNNGCRPIGSHRQGGGEACFFRIHSNGIKNEHWPEFDQTVFLADWAAVMITTSARSWLTVKIISRHAWVPRKCRGRGSGWNPSQHEVDAEDDEKMRVMDPCNACDPDSRT